MGMTIAEKVLARASGQSLVHPGQYVDARIDRLIADEEFYRMHAEAVSAGLKGGIPGIWDKERFHVVLVNFQPAMDQIQAIRQQKTRELVNSYGIKYFQDATCGVFHQIAVEDYVLPGELAVGSNSHSCSWGALNCAGTGMGEHELAFALSCGTIWFKVPETVKVVLEGDLPPWLSAKDVALHLAGRYTTEFALYKSIEFTGPGAHRMSMDSRMCLSTHAVELGGKFGIFNYDQKTEEFLATRRCMRHQLDRAEPVAADPDAEYSQVVSVSLEELEPQVAKPHSFENVVPVSDLRGTPIDQALIGSCTNGRLEDFEAVVRIVKGKKISPKTRFFVQPASWRVYKECVEKEIISILLDAGIQILAPGCHLCVGMQAKLAPGEVCITSTARNHRGRIGSGESFIYLAGPMTVAASALAGHIEDPREVLQQ